MTLTIVLAALGAVGIAASCGLRAFLPLLALSLGARMGFVNLGGASSWLTSDLALWTLSGAAVVEMLADKIPVMDHVLDAVGLVLRPIAAALGAFALLQHLPTPWAQIAALALGVGALGVQAAKAKVRLGSTALTLGAANPILSLAEDLTALALAALSILAPLALLFAAAILGFVMVRRRPAR